MQTIKMTNRQAYEMLTLVEHTIARLKTETSADTYYYDQIKGIETAIHESCPELVSRWTNPQALIKSVNAGDESFRRAGVESFKRASDEFDEWIDLNE